MSSLTISRLSGFKRGTTEQPTGDRITFGTAAECTVRFDPTWDRTVSPQHCTLERDGDGWVLCDESKDGVFLGANRLGPRTPLTSGAEFTLGRGGPRVRIEWDGAAPRPAPGATAPGAARPAPAVSAGASAQSFSRPTPASGASAPAQKIPPIPLPTPPASASPSPVKSPPPAAPVGSGQPWLVPVLVVAVLAAVGVGIFFAVGRRPSSDGPTMTNAAPTSSSAVARPVPGAALPGSTQTLLQQAEAALAPTAAASAGSAPLAELVPAGAGTGRAVIVGANRYPNPDNSLHYCVADAHAIAERLIARGLFRRENVVVLTDDSGPDAQPTSRNVVRAVRRMVEQAGAGDLVLFSYSGHGLRDPASGESLLATPDIDFQDLARSTVSGAQLQEIFAKLAATKLVVLLDACHSGGISAKGARALSGGQPEEFFQRFEFARGQVTIRSSAAHEESLERSDLGHGLFTYYLLDALDGAGDLDRDGIVSLSEVRTHINRLVPAWAREHGTKQTPSFTSNGPDGEVGDIPLTLVADQRQRRLALVQAARTRAVSLAGRDVISGAELDFVKGSLDRLATQRTFTPTEVSSIELSLRLVLGQTAPADFRLAARSLGAGR